MKIIGPPTNNSASLKDTVTCHYLSPVPVSAHFCLSCFLFPAVLTNNYPYLYCDTINIDGTLLDD